MTIRRRNESEWEEIRQQAIAFTGSALELALHEQLVSHLDQYGKELDDFKTSPERLKYVQGVRKGLNLAIMVFRSVKRQAKGPQARSRNAEEA